MHLGSNELSPYTENFMQRATSLPVMLAISDCAIGSGYHLGDEPQIGIFQKDDDKLPVWINDGEFEFVCRQDRKLEGLPDLRGPRLGVGDLW